jgi:hypothetical protein
LSVFFHLQSDLAFGPGAVLATQSFRTFPNLACGVGRSARGV